MPLETWPTTPPPSFSYVFDDEFKTLISTYQGQNEQAQTLARFAKRGFMIGYENLSLSADWHLIHNFHTKRRGQWETFWYLDFLVRSWVDEYVGRGTGAALTQDLRTKNTDVSTLVIRSNDVIKVKDTDFTFISGGGEAGVDRIAWIVGHYPADGALITEDGKGQLRIKARKADRFSDKFNLDDYGSIDVFRIREVQW